MAFPQPISSAGYTLQLLIPTRKSLTSTPQVERKTRSDQDLRQHKVGHSIFESADMRVPQLAQRSCSKLLARPLHALEGLRRIVQVMPFGPCGQLYLT